MTVLEFNARQIATFLVAGDNYLALKSYSEEEYKDLITDIYLLAFEDGVNSLALNMDMVTKLLFTETVEDGVVSKHLNKSPNKKSFLKLVKDDPAASVEGLPDSGSDLEALYDAILANQEAFGVRDALVTPPPFPSKEDDNEPK